MPMTHIISMMYRIRQNIPKKPLARYFMATCIHKIVPADCMYLSCISFLFPNWRFRCLWRLLLFVLISAFTGGIRIT
jgi:hypothetical protein